MLADTYTDALPPCEWRHIWRQAVDDGARD